MPIRTPDWVKHAVFYQIFPDRFARSARTNHLPGLRFKPWGSSPKDQGYQGGDLLGIVDKLDYLADLGVTALYLNPIFASAANHRYHPYDYYAVDPLLGGTVALRSLLDAAHDRNIRVVLDGVFNHASRGFWPFHHILENGVDSPYIDWFIIQDWPLRPYASTKDKPLNYAAWWDLPALPKLNTQNPDVQQYILDIARFWIAFGIDGWRLDVPHEIDDDDFWRAFRQVVKECNPDAYICGEIWGPAERWLQGDQFDATMNYPFASAALSFFGGGSLRRDYQREHLPLKAINAPAFAKSIDRMHRRYDWAVNHVQLNLLDSHDMARALWIMSDDKTALQLCVLFQMTMPGAPCIYYGDEVGMSAGDDPMCREAFPWHHTEIMDMNLRAFFKSAIALRHAHETLRTGTFASIFAEGHVYAFRRVLGRHESLVFFNSGKSLAHVEVVLPESASRSYRVAWPDDQPEASYHHRGRLPVHVPPRAALVLVDQS